MILNKSNGFQTICNIYMQAWVMGIFGHLKGTKNEKDEHL